MDYRKINPATRKNSLPRVIEALDSIAGSCWLPRPAEQQLAGQASEARLKTAFSIRQGMWQFTVMPLGLCYVPATFERLMEQVLPGVLQTAGVAYLNDIMVHTAMFLRRTG